MRPLRVLVPAAAVLALTLPAHPGEVKTDLPGLGTERQLVHKDDLTTAGTFEGTWMYVNRDARFVLWSRMKDGVPQVKLQYQSLANPEAFETDWDAKALYYLGDKPVTFSLALDLRTKDRLEGKWSWVLDGGLGQRKETADIVIFRTGYGRTLQMDFQNFERLVIGGGKNRIMRMPVMWTWTKIGKRELLWDELPF